MVGELGGSLERLKEEYSYYGVFSPESLDSFMKLPYALVPKGEQEWFLVVPRFIDLQVGWLWQMTPTYNIFVINRYIDFLAEIPRSIREELGFVKPFDALISGDFLELKDSYPPDDIWHRYKPHLVRREGDKAFRIKRGHHFPLICALIKDGVLPFEPHPVAKEDLREPGVNFTLRDYQQEAVEKFLQFGAMGCYWMPAAGKTYLGLYLMGTLKGRKLIIVPTLTLVEQWQENIQRLSSLSPGEWEIITYQSAEKALGRPWSLVIYDECQHLPAQTYARLATIDTKYRLGLSATPFREDGRSELIFALTGFPVGLDWKTIMEKGVVKRPTVDLVICTSLDDKVRVVERLLKEPLRTLIFCDGIALGKRLSQRLGVEFIYSETRKRLELLRRADVVVISRVGDEGISLGTLKRVIEFDFLFGSRRQELQRFGRLFHSVFTGKHYILMTEFELQRYKKRLYSIYERGFGIDFHHSSEVAAPGPKVAPEPRGTPLPTAPAPAQPRAEGEYYLKDGRGPFPTVQAAMDAMGLDKRTRPQHNRWDRLSTQLKEAIQKKSSTSMGKG